MERLGFYLQSIAKEKGAGPVAFPILDPQEYVVTVVPRDDEGFVPALRQRIETLYPGSRIAVARFPEGKSGDKLRLLMAELLEAAGQPAPTRGQTNIELYSCVPLVLWQAADFLIVGNAHLLNLHCLHYLRRDKGMVPAILVGRSKRLLTTIEKDEMILRRSLFLDADEIQRG